MPPIIEIKNITKTYHDGETETRVLHGVSFSIKKGEFVAIMGPSGSGKSTLLHILGFLDSFDSGEYFFDSKAAAGYTPQEIAHLRNTKLGFVFQAFNLLSRTSVLDNVKLPLLYSDVPEHLWNETALKAIESVGLSHRLDHQPSQLSGGERQRVAIARALVLSPPVIFADEPTGNLDPINTYEIVQILKKINDLGTTVILTTHNKGVIESIGKRVITMEKGKIARDDKEGKYAI